MPLSIQRRWSVLTIASRVRSRFGAGMTDTRTISQLEAEGYPWIGCECCKGAVWMPFKMNPADNPRAQFMDARRAGGQDEMRQMRQAARAILSRETVRRAGVFKELLRWHTSSRDFQDR